MPDITTVNGARLRVRPVPPHVYLLFRADINRGAPAEPSPPTISVQTKAGHSETMPAGEDHPAWVEYLDRRREWELENQRFLEVANARWSTLLLDYAVEMWSFDSGATWQDEPPESWQPPAALARAGIAGCGNRRVDYISLELLTIVQDTERVLGIAEGQTELREEEIRAALDGFRRGDSAHPPPDGARDTADSAARGDGSRARVGAKPGLLVRLFTRRARTDDGV